MKNFLNFLSEAKLSRAVEKAKRLGLQSDGHGNWYDRSGKYVARTLDGDLEFAKGRGKGGDEEAAKKAASAEPPAAAAPAAQEPAPEDSKDKESGEDGEDGAEDKGDLTVAFGRFNPPTVGHQKLLDAAASQSSGGDYKIYPSRSEDPKKNPLDADTKIEFMRVMFSKHGERIVNDPDMKSIFDVLKRADEDGYSTVNIMVGSDRQSEFEKLANKYNGELYDFETINVVSAGERDPDAEGISGMSASKMRAAAAENDFETFKGGVPKSLDDEVTKDIFNTLRRKMKVATKESYLWQIAPKLDFQTLRENYYLEKIFRIGDIVESLNTGLIGEIVRRGTNHLICVTPGGQMFKSWIKDLNEDCGCDHSKEKKNPPYEVGTDEYRKYAMRMTGTKQIKNFINKYKKKK
jgi:hypothetical protein